MLNTCKFEMGETSTPRRDLTKSATWATSKFKATKPLFPRFPNSISGFTTSFVDESHASLSVNSIKSVDAFTYIHHYHNSTFLIPHPSMHMFSTTIPSRDSHQAITTTTTMWFFQVIGIGLHLSYTHPYLHIFAFIQHTLNTICTHFCHFFLNLRLKSVSTPTITLVSVTKSI